MTNYIILLPPSEGKEYGGEGETYDKVKSTNTLSSLEKDRAYIIDKVQNYIKSSSWESLEKLFEVKGENLNTVYKNMINIYDNPTMNTIERFKGVMFKAIEYNSLPDKEKYRFDSSVLFIDGMFGVLKPKEKIPFYKLKINSKFAEIDTIKFWREELKNVHEKLFEKKIVIDLLPQEHRKVINYSMDNNLYRIDFKTYKRGKITSVGHESKKLKGELIRYLVGFDRIDRNILENFSHSQGYEYSPELSTQEEIVYFKG